jgi:hypothetical protein
MANEVLRQIQNPVGLNQVSGRIATIAQAQSVEKLKQAIHSFEWLKPADKSFFEIEKSTIPDSAFIDSPMDYFNNPQLQQMGFNETASIDLVNKLKQHNLNFHKGIKAFLKCGIEEALSGLKLTSVPSKSLLQIPIALDELLTSQKLKNPDRIQLQASFATVKAMFSTLKNFQNDNSHLQLNMMRFVRA